MGNGRWNLGGLKTSAPPAHAKVMHTIYSAFQTFFSGDGSTHCTTTACEKTVCEVGRVLEAVKGTEDECCPRYTCMPEALPLIKGAPAQQCPPITEPECGSFQEVKSITGPDNCPRYVCGKLSVFFINNSDQ